MNLRNRRGFTVLLLLVGMTMLATMMLLHRSGPILDLAARQNRLWLQLHLHDRPGRMEDLSACEPVSQEAPAHLGSPVESGPWLDPDSPSGAPDRSSPPDSPAEQTNE